MPLSCLASTENHPPVPSLSFIASSGFPTTRAHLPVPDHPVILLPPVASNMDEVVPDRAAATFDLYEWFHAGPQAPDNAPYADHTEPTDHVDSPVSPHTDPCAQDPLPFDLSDDNYVYILCHLAGHFTSVMERIHDGRGGDGDFAALGRLLCGQNLDAYLFNDRAFSTFAKKLYRL